MFLSFGVYYANFCGGDLMLVAVLIGGGVTFLINFRKILYEKWSGEVAAKTFRWIVISLSMITVFSIFSVINTRVQIRSTYAEFCKTLRTEDYIAASEYISPIFRENHPKGKGINRTKEFYRYCSEEKGKTIYVAPLVKSAIIFPEDSFISLIEDYGRNPVIPMEKVNGRWYLTGRGAYIFDWFFP
jgi:hypothetical protein